MSQEHLLWMQNYLKEIYRTPILENFLDLQIVEIAEGKATYSIRIIDRHSNFYGFVHGGTLASISDVAMGVACLSLGRRVVTIDMNISYIKNAPTGSMLTAIGQVVSNGRTVMRATGEIYHGEQLLVKSQASYFITGDFSEKDHPLPQNKD